MNFMKDKFNKRGKEIKQTYNLIKTISNTPEFIEAVKYGHSRNPYSFRQVYDPAKILMFIVLKL